MSHQLPARPVGFGGRWIALLAVAALYITSCATPAIEFAAERPATDFGDLRFLPDYEAGPQLGITALACGWAPPWTLPWLANVALLTGAIFLILRKNRWALGSGIVAALLALSTWALFNYDERLIRLLVGYYLWQASMLALIGGAGILAVRGARGKVEVS